MREDQWLHFRQFGLMFLESILADMSEIPWDASLELKK